MDDLAKARRLIQAQQTERQRLEQKVRAQDLELRRLRKALSILHARLNAKESADAA